MTTAIDDDATDGEDADGEGDYEIDLEVDDDDVVHSNICKVYMFVWLMSSGIILHAPFSYISFYVDLCRQGARAYLVGVSGGRRDGVGVATYMHLSVRHLTGYQPCLICVASLLTVCSRHIVFLTCIPRGIAQYCWHVAVSMRSREGGAPLLVTLSCLSRPRPTSLHSV